MANYYTSLCASVTISEEHFSYLFDLNTAVDSAVDGDDMMLDISPEIIETARKILEKTECGSGCEFSYNDGVLTICDTECAFIETLAEILLSVWKKFLIDVPFVVEYANWCDKARPDAFGGGVIVITAAEVHWMSTSEWAADLVKNIQEGAAAKP